MKKQWNYVEKEGNPKEPGTYWVTLIYPEWKDNKKNWKNACGGRYQIFCRS